MASSPSSQSEPGGPRVGAPGKAADPKTQELRREQAELARRLEVRASVDQARNGLVLGFAALLAAGVSWALLWDRYAKEPSELARKHPELFMAGSVAMGAAAAILFLAAVVVLRRSRRLARDEAALFSRLRELRRTLEIDA